MSAEKRSCFPKILFGCGCITMFILVITVVFVFFSSQDFSEPMEQETIDLSEQLVPELEPGFNLPDNAQDPVKKIRIELDMSMASLEIRPDAPPGQVNLTGTYDKANFDLETWVKERDGSKTYKMVLDSRRRMPLNTDDSQNKLVLHIPTEIPTEIDLEFNTGKIEVDLAGISLVSFKADVSTCSFGIRMGSENPVETQALAIKTSMGETRFNDFQNFRVVEGLFKTKMGSTRIYNSGPLKADANLELDANLGEIYFQVPENARIQADVDCKLGGSSIPGQTGQEEGPLITLKGSCFMAGIELSTGRNNPKMKDFLLDIWADQGIDTMINQYLTEVKPNISNYEHNRNSLRGLGYDILDLGHAEDALVVFLVNAKEDPKNEKSWRAVGAAHYELGQYKQAIVALEKALEIDPRYRSAEKLLRKAERGVENQDRDLEER